MIYTLLQQKYNKFSDLLSSKVQFIGHYTLYTPGEKHCWHDEGHSRREDLLKCVTHLLLQRVYEASEYAAEMFTHLFDSCCQGKICWITLGLPLVRQGRCILQDVCVFFQPCHFVHFAHFLFALAKCLRHIPGLPINELEEVCQ